MSGQNINKTDVGSFRVMWLFICTYGFMNVQIELLVLGDKGHSVVDSLLTAFPLNVTMNCFIGICRYTLSFKVQNVCYILY